MKDRFVWGSGDIAVVEAPATKGGPGSGNFGHAGRPGEVGGSAESSTNFPRHDFDKLRDLIETTPMKDAVWHGDQHWMHEAMTGMRLADADPRVDRGLVLMFAMIHDTHRENEYADPNHGRRAAVFAKSINDDILHLPPEKLYTLIKATVQHDRGTTTTNPTIGAMWDSDRLQLARVGVTPNSAYLSTAAGPKLIREATRALGHDLTWDEVYSAYEAGLKEGKGGTGSGDFHHAGRPGEQGGSASDSGEWRPMTRREWTTQNRRLEKLKSGSATSLRDIAAASDGKLTVAAVREFKSLWLDGHLGNLQYVAMQFAASKEFGVPVPKYVQSNKNDLLSTMPRASRIWPRYVEYARIFLRAQYEVTQARMKEAGMTEILLYRGMKLPEATADRLMNTREPANLKMNPLSSWTESWKVAGAFADGEYQTSGFQSGYGVTLMSRVPASRVLSFSSTGMGSARQKEVVLSGGPLSTKIW